MDGAGGKNGGVCFGARTRQAPFFVNEGRRNEIKISSVNQIFILVPEIDAPQKSPLSQLPRLQDLERCSRSRPRRFRPRRLQTAASD